MDLHSFDCPIDLDLLFDALGLRPDVDRDVFRLAFDCGHIYSRDRQAGRVPEPALISRNAAMWRAARGQAEIRRAARAQAAGTGGGMVRPAS